MFKRASVVCITLFLLLLLIASGCGSGKAGQQYEQVPLGETKSLFTQESTKAPAAAATTAEPVKAEEMTIKNYDFYAYKPSTKKVDDVPGSGTKNGKVILGYMDGLSGSSAYIAKECMAACRMAVENQGTIWGKEIELLTGDAVDPASARSEYERMKSLGCRIFMGGLNNSQTDKSICNFVDNDKVLLFSNISWDVELFSRGVKNMFQWCPSFLKFGDQLANATLEISQEYLGIKPEDLKIAICYQEGAGEVCQGYVDGLARRNKKPAFIEGYPQDRKDFTPLVAQLIAGNYDVIVPFSSLVEGPALRRKMVEMGYKPPLLLACGSYYDQSVFTELGNDVTNGCCTQSYTTGAINENEAAGLKEFKAMFNAEFGRDPLTHALMSYSATTTWMRMMDLIGEMPIPELVEELRKVDVQPGQSPAYWGLLPDPETGRNLRGGEPCVVGQWQDGKLIMVYPKFLATSEDAKLYIPWHEKGW